eukprot:scaffold29795_cov46-Phaeocystis_antarctica.AAC.4
MSVGCGGHSRRLGLGLGYGWGWGSDERVELLVVGAIVGVEQRALLGLHSSMCLQLARVATAAPQAARVVLAAAA